jgi:hypothetical protein
MIFMRSISPKVKGLTLRSERDTLTGFPLLISLSILASRPPKWTGFQDAQRISLEVSPPAQLKIRLWFAARSAPQDRRLPNGDKPTPGFAVAPSHRK